MPEKLYELDYISQSTIDRMPPAIVEGINMFVWYGCPAGGFLAAVLSNDLKDSVARADEGSMASLHAICQYVYNAVPSACHGSREKYKAHLKKGADRLFAMATPGTMSQ